MSQKFEYKTSTLSQLNFENRLNDFGKDEWELILCTFIPDIDRMTAFDNSRYHCIFKRQKPLTLND